MNPIFKVGDVVRLKKEFLDNCEWSLGFCYNIYQSTRGYIFYFIFENGGHDGFTYNDTLRYLIKVSHCFELSYYQFESLDKLEDDYYRGKFNVVFKSCEARYV